VRRYDLPFRAAHHVVGRFVRDSIAAGRTPALPAAHLGPVDPALLLAADDALAADAVLARVLGVAPEKFPVLREARALGLAAAELENVEMLGEKPEAVAVSDFRLPEASGVEVLSTGFWRFLRNPFLTKPHVNAKKCTACGQCRKICPAQTIRIEPGPPPHAVIESAKCIYCYCCDEVCGDNAITLRKGWLARLLIRG